MNVTYIGVELEIFSFAAIIYFEFSLKINL